MPTTTSPNPKKRKTGDINVHRRILPSQPTTMATQETTINHTDEVPVMPIPRRVSKIAPDYFNIELPFCETITLNTGSGGGNIASVAGKNYIIVNQLNSILAGSSLKSRGVDSWTNIYDYYRVTQCDIKVTMFIRSQDTNFKTGNDTTTSTSGTGICMREPNNVYMAGFHLSDSSSSSDWTTYRDFGEAKQGGFRLLHGSSSEPCFTTLQYTFRPQDWDLHVTESGLEERWTPVAAAPADPKYFHFGLVGAHPLIGS